MMTVLQKIIERLETLKPARPDTDVQIGKNFAYENAIEVIREFISAEEKQIRQPKKTKSLH